MRRISASFFDGLFPFRGTWDFRWIVLRYFKNSFSAATPRKAANALLALAEMKTARPITRSRPAVLRLEPCNVCTLSCPGCACGTHADRREKGFLSLEDLDYVLEQIHESVFIVRLDGMGEPMMHPLIFEMIERIKSFGLSVSMSTNFQPARCGNPDDFIDSGLDRIVVCVDGSTQSTYEKYRPGGRLDIVENRVLDLVARKRSRRADKPFVEIQMLDLPHNHHQIDDVRRLARSWKVDRFTVTRADPTGKKARLPRNPKRCFWLWFVVTLGWNLEYRSCTNAWSLPWPDVNARDVPIEDYWNHLYLREARKYNRSRDPGLIANTPGCKCNRCFEMLVDPMNGDYFCE